MNQIPNLELLEAKTLQLLQDEKRPLISLRNLLRLIKLDETFATLDETNLAQFIQAHELFSLTQPDQNTPDFIEPAVYLTTRVPSDREIKAHMAIELENITSALQTAQKEATQLNDNDLAQQIQDLLNRANQLRENLKNPT